MVSCPVPNTVEFYYSVIAVPKSMPETALKVVVTSLHTKLEMSTNEGISIVFVCER